jgi:hypothetical protein
VRRLLPLALLGLALAACGGGDEPQPEAAPAAPVETDRSEAPPPDTTTEGAATEPAPPAAPAAEALPGLPRWTAGYRGWTQVNTEPIPPRDADPHLGTKNVFASRPAQGGVYPDGTIIVKEAFRPGKDFIGLIATMRKTKGANPEHNDWVFVEWARDAANEPFTELASGGVCEGCHSGVAGQDYVFTRP